jgi:glycosyltransferase involved in cell wall biosynthesis
MKILYLCADLGIPVLGRKGASVHVRSLASALRQAGNSVVIAASLRHKTAWEPPADFEVPICHFPPRAGVRKAATALKAFNQTLAETVSLPGEIRRILHNEDLRGRLTSRFDADPPDFIYERASAYGTAGVSLARTLNRPLVVELNAALAVEQKAYGGTALGELAALAERWTLTHADAVLVVSAPLRDHVLSLGVAPDRVHVIPNGVDAQLFRPRPPDASLRKSWNLAAGPILGFVGGLRPWHGVETLPALLARLVPRFPTVQLVVVGDGPLRAKFECDLRRRDLTAKVVLTGAVAHEKVPELISQFDVALAPYPQPEHCFYFSPLKLFEYMACGVPVVAARLGQIVELLKDGETGLLYPAGDLDALTAACERLLGDAALRQRLGQAAARVVRAEYTWGRNAQRIVQLASTLPREQQEVTA